MYPLSLRMSSDVAKSVELGTRALKALFSPPICRRREEALGAWARGCVVSGEPGVEPEV